MEEIILAHRRRLRAVILVISFQQLLQLKQTYKWAYAGNETYRRQAQGRPHSRQN